MVGFVFVSEFFVSVVISCNCRFKDISSYLSFKPIYHTGLLRGTNLDCKCARNCAIAIALLKKAFTEAVLMPLERHLVVILNGSDSPEARQKRKARK